MFQPAGGFAPEFFMETLSRALIIREAAEFLIQTLLVLLSDFIGFQIPLRVFYTDFISHFPSFTMGLLTVIN